jgi:FkbM family methyltransferase
MIVKRRIVELSKRWLPSVVKNRLRHWLMNQSKSGVKPDLPFHINVKNGETLAGIANLKDLKVTPGSEFDFKHLFESDWEEFRFFLSHCSKCRCLFDVGASRGVYSTVFANHGEKWRAYAFESSSASCAEIHKLLVANALAQRVTVVNTFVGEKEGEIQVSEEHCGYVQAVPVDTNQMISMKTRSLDSLCKTHGIVPDLLKIDVEGYEHEVLQGATWLLAAHKPIVMLELHLFFLEARGLSPTETLNQLETMGYILFDLQGRRKSAVQHTNTFTRTIKVAALHSSLAKA